MRVRQLLPVAILVGTACATACADKADTKASPSGAVAGDTSAAHEGKSESAEAPETVTTNVAVTIEQVVSDSFVERIGGTGTVTARTGHYAALAAPAPARITAVKVAVGDVVRVGQSLITFESTSFDAAVSTADAALATAEKAAARAQRLVDAGVSPRKDLEVATAELATARANATNAKRAQQLSRLQSPINGVVTRLNAVLGANADVAQTLVEVADTHTLDLLLTLSPANAAHARIGQRVALRDAANAAETVADGRIADVAAVVDSESRGVTVRVAIDKQQRTVRIGETLFGDIAAGVHRGAIVIPDDALVPTGEGFQVFVVDGAHKAHARAVTVGGRQEHRVWIADGLKVGEQIVTQGAYGVDDGNTVVEASKSSESKASEPTASQSKASESKAKESKTP